MASLLGNLDVTTAILLAGVGLLAGLSRGFSGFGAALIFVPLASMLAGPKLAGPVLAVIDAVFTIHLLPAAWRMASRRAVGIMFLGALLGIPAGTLILKSFDAMSLRWLISIMAAGMFALLASGWRYLGKPRDLVTAGVGAISGLFSGIAQIGGPPVVSYWLGLDTDHSALRANIILYFALSTLLTLVSYGAAGLFDAATLKLAVVAGPAYGIGTVVGSRLFPLASARLFRRISLVLIAGAVVLSLPVWR